MEAVQCQAPSIPWLFAFCRFLNSYALRTNNGEAEMFKAIVNSIVSALRSIGRVGRALLALLGNLIHRMLGGAGSVSDMPAPPAVSIDSDDCGSAEFDAALQQSYAMSAAIVQAWAAASLSAGAYQPVPAKLPHAVADWLPGLRPSELLRLIDADSKSVSAHLRSQELISEVRSVRLLEAIAWVDDTPKPAPDEPAPSFLSVVAVAHENARFQAVRGVAGFRAAAL
jgi:hypothetical protein